jgi:GNAT superfamily N-acetyltransferase
LAGRDRRRALVEAVVQWARDRGCGHLVLSVTDTNRSARGFYEAWRFAHTGERRPLREGSDLDMLIFAKTL